MQVVRPVGAEGESWHCKPKQADLEEEKYEFKENYQNTIWDLEYLTLSILVIYGDKSSGKETKAI